MRHTLSSNANLVMLLLVAVASGCAGGPLGMQTAESLTPPYVPAPIAGTTLQPPPPTQPIYRNQSPENYPVANAVHQFEETTPGTSGALTRNPMPASGEVVQTQFAAPPVYAPTNPTAGTQPGDAFAANNNAPFLPPQGSAAGLPPPPDSGGYFDNGAAPINLPPPLPPTRDLDILLQETQTGRFMFGVGVNSDAGVSGQITIDERNFDYKRIPFSWEDVVNGTAFRGAGQGFRLEAAPGTQVQRYMVTFTEPYLFDTDISFSTSGYFFTRAYRDWQEERIGGRLGLGYRLAPDLSVGATGRAETVEISQPRIIGVPILDEAVGNNTLYSIRGNITHDTRDLPFAPTQGHFIDLSFEQAFGDFQYPRGELDMRKYFLLMERPDGSGRHTLGLTAKVGLSGSDTPIFENYFAGGYSSMRGFNFRGASPTENTVQVGGQLRLLSSAEYMFPLTADDMVKGVVFCDFGTVEREIQIDTDNLRLAPGVGMRINIPALGPAPLAFDLAVPIMHAEGDNIQNFSFFFGFNR